MSVGGQVIAVSIEPEKVWVNTREIVYKNDQRTLGDQCAIYVVRNDNSLQIKQGDSLWWQGRSAYWTPKPDDGREDVAIKRIGYSHEPAKPRLV